MMLSLMRENLKGCCSYHLSVKNPKPGQNKTKTNSGKVKGMTGRKWSVASVRELPGGWARQQYVIQEVQCSAVV